MMDYFFSNRSGHVRDDALRSVARELSKHYAELSGAGEPMEQAFSIGRVLRAAALGQPLVGREAEICQAAAQMAGEVFNPHRSWVPFGALTRALGTTPGNKGGYLTGMETLTPTDRLRPWSVTADAGMPILAGLRNNVSLPRVTEALSQAAGWVGENVAPASDVTPTLGVASMTPRAGIALVQLPLQLLQQAEAADPFVAALLLRAAGELLDQAVLDGAGGAAPLGLRQAAGVNVTDGANLAHAGLLEARRKIVAAGGRDDRLRWIAPGAVQELLGARERSTGGGRFLWDDDGVLGRPAAATRTAPEGTLIVGDFAAGGVLGLFGPGLRVDVSPTAGFSALTMTARVVMFADVAFHRPEAFTVISSVT
jgi:HK97 family phage major capsid protein